MNGFELGFKPMENSDWKRPAFVVDFIFGKEKEQEEQLG